jgi:hypothetical protein
MLTTVSTSSPRPLQSGGAVLREDVLFVCLHEVARQVTVSCEERGALLMRIRE